MKAENGFGPSVGMPGAHLRNGWRRTVDGNVGRRCGRRSAWSKRTWGLSVAVVAAWGTCVAALVDDFEAGGGGWTFTGTWGVATECVHSPSHGITDSPGSYYDNGTDSTATMASDVDLSTSLRPVLSFWHEHSLEAGYDFGRVEVSTDGGASWSDPPLASYTGESGPMARQQLDLSAYAGEATVRVRFRLVTDGSVVRDGWAIDDVVIDDAPAPVTLATPTGGDLGRNHVDLSWGAAGGDFAAYVVLRSTSSGFSTDDATVLARIESGGTTTWTDITANPKTGYHYRVLVEGASGLVSESNEVSATTLAGMDFPFLDDGEGGGGTWVADAPWGLSGEEAYRGGAAWADSPGGDYADGIAGQSLTLAAPVDLSGSSAPALCFAHKLVLGSGDAALVEVSTDDGSSWTPLASYNPGSAPADWQPVRVGLSGYREPSVLVRFRLTTDSSNTADGWHLDDISIAESPAPVAAPLGSEVTSSSARVTWTASGHPQVTGYVVCRTSSGEAGLDDLVAELPSSAGTSHVDGGLVLNTDYSYRVFAVTSYRTYSEPSAYALAIHTLSNPAPWSEGFEGVLDNWVTGGNSGTNDWASSAEAAQAGAACLADTPGTSYSPGDDTWIDTSVDLTGTEWPVLSFHDRLDLGTGDWVRLEVSAPGKPTRHMYGCFEGGHADWREQRIDLSEWKGSDQVKLRFRLAADGDASVGSGWLLDSMDVSENPDRAVAAVLPVTEDFEGDLQGTWLASGWYSAPDAQSVDGVASGRVSDSDRMRDVWHGLTLSKPVTLGPAVQATYWVRGELASYSYFRLQYSEDDGASWPEVGAVNLNYGTNLGEFTRYQADLSGLAGKTVRLRLHLSADTRAPTASIRVDKFTLDDMPAAVSLDSATPSLRSIDLGWSETPLGGDFVRYELWRSTSANVSVTNGEKIFETTDALETDFEDTGLNIGGTYYYRVFTVDVRDTFIPSNELASTTVPVVLPFVDGMEATDNWVIGSHNANAADWGISADSPQEGGGCMESNPGGHYGPATDSYFETAVDLTGTEWPVLSFHDQLDLGAADWVRLEVSATGKPTRHLYGCYEGGHADWREQRIDLSEWKGSDNVRLRFRLWSDDAPTTGTGWRVDAVSVSENPDRAVAAVLPVTEDFEGDLQGTWLASGWHSAPDAQSVDGVASGRVSDSDRMRDVWHGLTLTKPVTLGPAVQATYWVRGELASYSYFRLHYSEDDGASWPEVGAVNLNYGTNLGGFTRYQADLSGLAGKTVRLRLHVSADTRAPTASIRVDKFTLDDMPAAVSFDSATPSLRSIDLDWSETPLGGDFVRYELWRSTSANVSVTNGEKVFETTNALETDFEDTGLNIGGTYYYRVFTVDVRDTFIPSNELASTTVPVVLPFADGMEATDNWVIGSHNANAADWGISADSPQEGGGCMESNPGGHYGPATDSYFETAVDLTGTEWPVLSFHDQLDLGAADWVRLEVSATGKPTRHLYGCYEGGHADWREQRIDLSEWKGSDNVRLRFRLWSDDAPTTGTGWRVDAVSVSENPDRAVAAVLPVTEDFEGDLQGTWLASGWHSAPDAQSVDGVASGRVSDSDRMRDVWHGLTLSKPVTLGPAVQATYWVRGELASYSYFRLQYSEDDGASWPEVGAVNLNYGTNLGEFTRYQADLSGLAGKTVRLRLHVSADTRAPTASIRVEKFTLDDMPQAVLAEPIDDIQPTSLRLNWQASTLPTFVRYRIYRSLDANVTTASTLLAEIDEAGTESFADTDLQTRTTYYYRIFVVDDRDTHSPSGLVSATTLGIPLPIDEDFEGGLDGWTTTGEWQAFAGTGRGGGAALVDSPGDYQASTTTHAQFAVDPRGMDWPVLRFWDKHAFAGGSWGAVEISTNGTNWGNRRYGVTGIRTEWREQAIDLSPWKDEERLFIRFIRGTDTNLADGWTIDDLTLTDHVAAPDYPVWDDGGGLPWLSARWQSVTDDPYQGTTCLHDSPEGRYAPNVAHQLVLAHPLDLTSAVDPKLTLFLRGQLLSYSYFRVHVSTDEGLNWTEISSLNRNYGYNSPDWELLQASLSPWLGQVIRLRIESSGDSRQPASDLYLDNIGIGEEPPGAPVPASPVEQAIVTELRPTLTVENAVDPQSDPMTYRFEVYADEALTQLVAQVPAVASGAGVTSWQVDVNLPDNHFYWWRCRADDGDDTGPWSEVATFAVNEINNLPNVPTLVSPLNGTTIYSLNELVIWRTTDDPDPGDRIIDYHLEVDDDADFSSPLVSQEGIEVTGLPDGAGFLVGVPFADLGGIEAIRAGGWFWRIRARDSRFGYGAWSGEEGYFRTTTDYERFLYDTYTPAERLDPAISGDDVDPDGDGVGQMIEFACGMDLEVRDPEGAPVMRIVEVGGEDHLAFEFDRKIGTDLVVRLQASPSLSYGWQDSGATVEVLGPIDAGRERCRLVDPHPIGHFGRRFVRVEVALP